jgi:hypothetical protein
MLDSATISTPNTPKKDIRVDKTRLKLLNFIEQESESYLKNCQIQLNSKLPSEIVRKYSILRSRQPSRYESSKRESKIKQSRRRISTGSVEFKREEKIFFSKFIQEIGKEFIDLRKQDVGIKKMEKFKKLTIDTNLSFMENLNSLKSSNRRRSATSFRFSHVNFKQKLEEMFLNKEEQGAKNIQDNYNKLQEMVRLFKCTGSKDLTNQEFKVNSNNFLKFNEELFDILEFKGIKFDPKVLSTEKTRRMLRGSYEIPQNPFSSNQLFAKTDQKELKHKSNSIINVGSNGNNNPFVKKKLFSSCGGIDYNDNLETNVNTSGNSPMYKFTKRTTACNDDEAENYFKEDIEFEDNVETPIARKIYINYESNNQIENFSDIEAENRVSNLYDESEYNTPINFKALYGSNGSKHFVNLIQCNRTSYVRCDSEVSKFSEVSKSDISRANSCSVSKEQSELSNDSISEVSNDFEFNELNNSCS